MDFRSLRLHRGETTSRPAFLLASISLLIILLGPVGPAAAQLAPWPARDVDYPIDSGWRSHPSSGGEQVIWSTIVATSDSSWLRLFFDDLVLGTDPETFEGARLRMTSMDDGASQTLNAITASQWQSTSAYFNGDTVVMELLAPANGGRSRVKLDRVRAGLLFDGRDTICGDRDDRVLSSDPRIGRGESGCSHWIVEDAHRCLISAGHCGYAFTVIEFNVPLSDQFGNIRHPAPKDQYAVDPESVQSYYYLLGDDWGYFGLFPNTETGLTAYQAQDSAFKLTAPPDGPNPEIRLTGYGMVSDPVDPTWNRAQKTHLGELVNVKGTILEYTADTTTGNSGSPVIDEASGHAIGVHTNGGCTRTGGANGGTAVTHPGLQDAMTRPLGLCGPYDLDVSPIIAGQLCQMRAVGVEPGSVVTFYYTTDGPGKTSAPEFGVDLGLLDPVCLGQALTNRAGIASLTQRISTNAARRRIWLQGVTVGRASKVVEAVVNF